MYVIITCKYEIQIKGSDQKCMRKRSGELKKWVYYCNYNCHKFYHPKCLVHLQRQSGIMPLVSLAEAKISSVADEQASLYLT